MGLVSSCGGGGGSKTVVPELRGRTIPQAFRLLADRHLCPYRRMPITGRTTRRLPVVADEDPRAGARVDRGTYVTISLRAPNTGELSMPEFACTEH